jgi:hypothetical protein
MSKNTTIGKQRSGQSAEAIWRGVVCSVHRLPEEAGHNDGADYLIFQQGFQSRTSRMYSRYCPIDRNFRMDNIKIILKKSVLTVIGRAQL